MKFRTLTLTLLAIVLTAACGGPEQPAAQVPETARPATNTPSDTSSQAATTETARIELAQADAGAATSPRFSSGEHYEVLSPAQPTSSGPGQVEVAEFFMYSCIHCYNFEPYVEEWLSSKPEYVNFVRVPTVWNPGVRLHAQAFYALEALGKTEDTHAAFFREFHNNSNYLSSEEALTEFAGRFEISEEQFKGAFDSFAIHAKLQRADELTRRYRVNSTPSIVVNGKYLTNATMAGGYPALLELINELAASERSGN